MLLRYLFRCIYVRGRAIHTATSGRVVMRKPRKQSLVVLAYTIGSRQMFILNGYAYIESVQCKSIRTLLLLIHYFKWHVFCLRAIHIINTRHIMHCLCSHANTNFVIHMSVLLYVTLHSIQFRNFRNLKRSIFSYDEEIDFDHNFAFFYVWRSVCYITIGTHPHAYMYSILNHYIYHFDCARPQGNAHKPKMKSISPKEQFHVYICS